MCKSLRNTSVQSLHVECHPGDLDVFPWWIEDPVLIMLLHLFSLLLSKSTGPITDGVMASFEAAPIQWESQNMLSWKGPTRTINSNPWPWAVPPPRVTSPSAWDYCPKASWTCVRLVLWPLPWEACPHGEAAGSRSGIPQCMSFTFRRDKLIWARLSGHLMRQSWMQQCNEAGADSGLCSRALCNVDFRPEVPLKWQADTQKSFEQQLSDKQKPSTSPL